MLHLRSIVACAIGVGWLLLTVARPVSADTVLSNLGQPTGGFGLGIGTNNPTTLGNLKRAQGFRAGANSQGYQLNSVTLSMGGSTGSGLGNFLLELHRIDSVTTSTHLGDFVVTSNPIAPGAYTYQFANSSLVLLPMTEYSIVARSPASSGPTVSQYGWRQADGTDALSLPDWQIGGPYVGSEGQSSWAPVRTVPHQFSINATAVPEPATLMLMLIAGGALLLRRR